MTSTLAFAQRRIPLGLAIALALLGLMMAIAARQGLRALLG